ncbi:MBL fold metallo-hydrolase [Marinobacterium litorale]|uniref:MBL fold metallo-hydrolase n=1 Tax=Marinobacterium litorale TaxID=404770 RepID=UPI0004112D27|nr:MBL fold metallo-hydrolase [Marinobacterium litorale]
MAMHIEAFFHADTFTYSYVVADQVSGQCAVIDSVLDYTAESGQTSTTSADQIVNYIHEHGYTLEWVLETHVHADHLSAAQHIREKLGGKLAIGNQVGRVQETFGRLFNAGPEFAADGSQFDHLFADGETFTIGQIPARVIYTPGHTPSCVTYLIGDAAFVGDTLFMPDYGTARCDFPGGDAATLYHSIRKLFELPAETRVFMCHDYKAEGRDEFLNETTIGEEKASNVHVNERISEAQFVQLRQERDSGLGMPKLILPSVQVNMRAGEMPPPEANGIRYLKIPVDAL